MQFRLLSLSVCLLLSVVCSFSNAQAQNGQQQRATTQQGQTGQQMTPEQRAYMQQLQQKRAQDQARNQQQNASSAGGQSRLATIPTPRTINRPQQPFPEQSATEKKYLSDLLDYWEKSSQQIKRSTCDFRRWDYNSEVVNWRDPGKGNQLAAYAIAEGNIRFSSPDKGMYETTRIWNFEAPPTKQGQEPKYKLIDNKQNKEKWVCDGKAIYEYDFIQSVLYDIAIPPEMQGQGLANSPLPFFLFGADKQKIMERYWVRVITPKTAENEYWLEAYPKKLNDARIYRKLDIVIAREDFLPKSVHMYLANYDPKKGNFESRAFVFANRQVNNQLDGLRDFFRVFVRPGTPIGWARKDRAALEREAQQQSINSTQRKDP